MKTTSIRVLLFIFNSAKVLWSVESILLELIINVGSLPEKPALMRNLSFKSQNLVFFFAATSIILPWQLNLIFKYSSFSLEESKTEISELFCIYNSLKVWLSFDKICRDPKKYDGYLFVIPAREQNLLDNSENGVLIFAWRVVYPKLFIFWFIDIFPKYIFGFIFIFIPMSWKLFWGIWKLPVSCLGL